MTNPIKSISNPKLHLDILSQSDRVVIFRNYEGVIARYNEPEDTSFLGCPENCTICKDREARGLDHPQVGLEKLYSGESISLEPTNLYRNKRKHRKHV